MKNKLIALLATGLLAACGAGSNSTDTGASSGAADAQSKQLARVAKSSATTSSYQNAVQSLYIAYFGRPADPAGLANFEAQLQSDGSPTDVQSMVSAYSTNSALKTLIDGFGTSAESKALYGSGTATSFVTAVFQNVVGRSPATAGLNFYVNAVTSGQYTQGQVALAVMSGALANSSTQGLLDAQLIQNRISEATYFTAQVSAQNGANFYTGATAAATARSMLANVTASTAVTPFQTEVGATVTGLVNNMTVAGTTTGYSGSSYVSFTNNSNGAIVLDAVGNRYAVDANTGAVVSLTYNASLTGLTYSSGYLLYNGNIVGFAGYSAGTNNSTIVVFYFTANGLMGIGQFTQSASAYSFACNSACTANNGSAVPTALQEFDTQVGTGAVAAFGKTVTVNYTGWLFNPAATGFEGTEFDSSVSDGSTFTFVLGEGNVIPGWDQGVIGMKVGGTRTLIIPSALAYGSAATGSIPANSALIFSVQLISVN